MRAILIDAKNKTISEIDVPQEDSLDVLQGYVEGLIECVTHVTPRDIMYVNEEGRLLGFTYGFSLPKIYANQHFVGNAVVIGCSSELDDGDEYPASPFATLEWAKSNVVWLRAIHQDKGIDWQVVTL